jgi:hypothetical protein
MKGVSPGSGRSKPFISGELAEPESVRKA